MTFYFNSYDAYKTFFTNSTLKAGDVAIVGDFTHVIVNDVDSPYATHKGIHIVKKTMQTVTVSGSNCTCTGSGSYEFGTTATIKCTPAEGYEFTKWSDNNTDAERTIVVESDVTLTATCTQKQA